MVIYPAVFTATKDKKDTYLVYIPDLDGMTEGYGLQDAYKMARDYMGCTFLEMSGDEFPKASGIKEIDPMASPFANAGNSFVSLVDFDVDAYRRQMDKKAP